MKFFNFLINIVDVFVKAKEIRQNEDIRRRYTRFAFTSIIYSVLAFLFAFGGTFLFTVTDNLLVIFIIVIAIALLISALISFINALARVIAQLTINRGAMSWIALVIFIASIIGSVIAIMTVLG